MDLKPGLAVIVDETYLSEPVHEKLTRDRVVPIRSARVSWLIFGDYSLGLAFLAEMSQQ